MTATANAQPRSDPAMGRKQLGRRPPAARAGHVTADVPAAAPPRWSRRAAVRAAARLPAGRQVEQRIRRHTRPATPDALPTRRTWIRPPPAQQAAAPRAPAHAIDRGAGAPRPCCRGRPAATSRAGRRAPPRRRAGRHRSRTHRATAVRRLVGQAVAILDELQQGASRDGPSPSRRTRRATTAASPRSWLVVRPHP